jgi:hypothetical protein
MAREQNGQHHNGQRNRHSGDLDGKHPGDELMEVVDPKAKVGERLAEYARILQKLHITETHGVYPKRASGGWQIYVRDRRVSPRRTRSRRPG